MIHSLPSHDTPAAAVLAERLASRLLAVDGTIVTAESCTAGRLAGLISEAPSATRILDGGFVVYREGAKARILGVAPRLIEAHGVVSAQVARAMAEQALARSGAMLAIALTGLTGSASDDDGNPIGRVHIAALLRSGAFEHRHCEFGERPPKVLTHAAMQQALLAALSLLQDG